MSFKVNPGRPGFHTATPYLIVEDAARAIDFYKEAFGATELIRDAGPGEPVRHAEILIGDSPIMLGGSEAGRPRGGPPAYVYLYLDDADGAFQRAIAAGATELSPMKDQDYGDRSGGLTDPFGHVWYVATHKHGA